MEFEIHYGEEWAALYVDGKLTGEPGDSYLAEQRAFELLGVTLVHDDAWLRGGNGVGDPAPARTLEEVAAYRDEREARMAEAKSKRDLAAKLLADANLLDPGGPGI